MSVKLNQNWGYRIFNNNSVQLAKLFDQTTDTINTMINILLTIILLLPTMAYGEENCNGTSIITVNGDDGGEGDQCEFYTDLYRTRRSIPTTPNCQKVIAPINTDNSILNGHCRGLAQHYIDNGIEGTQANFASQLTQSLQNGNNTSVVLLTDHGSKISPDVGQSSCNSTGCTVAGSTRESQVSMGSDDITESEMRDIILQSRRTQAQSLCGCTEDNINNCDCELPPLIMNFDHCYSGGMQNAFFQDGKPIENVCGISSASPEELSYSHENISKSLNELSLGVNGKYRTNYRKYDTNNDRKISLAELSDYHSKKAVKSLPIRTSQKFLLDYFNDTHGDFSGLTVESEILDNEMYLCYEKNQEERYQSIASVIADTNFKQESEQLNDRIASLASRLDVDITDQNLLASLDAVNNKANDINELQQNIKSIIDGAIVETKKQLIDGPFYDINLINNKIVANDQELLDIKEEICNLPSYKPKCDDFNNKASILNDKILSPKLSQEEEEKLIGELTKESKKYEEIFNRINRNTEQCIEKEVCKKYVKIKRTKNKLEHKRQQVEQKMKKGKKGISITVRNILKNMTKTLKEKTTADYSEGIKKCIEGFENEYLNDQSLAVTKADINNFSEYYLVEELIEDNIPPVGECIDLSYRNIKRELNETRKLDQMLKTSMAKKHMLENMDTERLEDYNKILKCEQTELFSY